MSTLVRVALFSGLSRLSTVPAGNLAKASLVGANTVNGPGPESVSTKPAAFTAATSVVWSFEFTAFWMMFFDGYIGAPPTLTVFSDMVSAASGAAVPTANARAAAAAIKVVRLDARRLNMGSSVFAVKPVGAQPAIAPAMTRRSASSVRDTGLRDASFIARLTAR